MAFCVAIFSAAMRPLYSLRWMAHRGSLDPPYVLTRWSGTTDLHLVPPFNHMQAVNLGPPAGCAAPVAGVAPTPAAAAAAGAAALAFPEVRAGGGGGGRAAGGANVRGV